MHDVDMQADKTTSNFTRVFLYSAIDSKDDIEEKLERARAALGRLVGNSSEREAVDILTNASFQTQKHDEIMLGLLGTILTEPTLAPKCFRDLTFISRDFSVVVETISDIVLNKYQKLTDVSRSQCLWMIKELVKINVNGTESLCWNTMRQIAGGDTSGRNLWLSETMLDIYSENSGWLDKYPILIAAVIYTYVRLLEDHTPPHLSNLKQKEVNFVVNLIREHFTDVVMNQQIGLGRDFLRLLQAVARVPEIELLWKDIYYNPKALSPHLTGVAQLLNLRTSRKYFLLRITPDMEKKLNFLTASVRFGLQKRYQEWFQRQYLSTPESQTLRADLIRFIVCVIHPPNEILCSDILPRWAVIGWLLTTCTNPVAAANAKLALFYDWLLFDANKDNIMNIEPGILVIHHSLKPHLAITTTLLDFLIRLTYEYWPAVVDKIRLGIGSALKTILVKKVLPSLDSILENPKFEPELRNAIQEHLIVLLDRNNGTKIEGLVNDTNRSNRKDYVDDIIEELSDKPKDRNSDTKIAIEGLVSDVKKSNNRKDYIDDDIIEDRSNEIKIEVEGLVSDTNTNTNTNRSNRKDYIDDIIEDDNDDTKPAIEGVLSDVNRSNNRKDCIDDIIEDRNNGTRTKIAIEGLMSDMNKSNRKDYIDDIIEELSDKPIEKETRERISKCLLHIFKSDLSKTCVNEETSSVIDNLIITPVSELLNVLIPIKPSDKSLKMKNLMRVLADLINGHPSVAYKILIILYQKKELAKNSKREENFPAIYKNLSNLRGLKLEAQLLQDLKCCWENDQLAVAYLCPVIYTWFESECLTCSNSYEIMRLITSTLDSSQLQELVWRVMQGDVNLMEEGTIYPLISRSLEWETWEQHCLWTLLEAHNFSIDEFLPIITQLDSKKNSEALTALLNMLKREKPTQDILGPLLCRRPNTRDHFLLTLLLTWSTDSEDELAEVLTAVLVRASGSGSPVKRKRGPTGSRGTASPVGSPPTPTVENVLAHLDQLREHTAYGEGIFTKDIMQAALLQVQSWVNDSQKHKYKDLLALAAEESRSIPKRSLKAKKRKI